MFERLYKLKNNIIGDSSYKRERDSGGSVKRMSQGGISITVYLFVFKNQNTRNRLPEIFGIFLEMKFKEFLISPYFLK